MKKFGLIDELKNWRGEDYLSEKNLLKLKDYQYRSIDLSPLTKYVLKYWWEYVTTWMPIWLAPNLITLIGLSFIILNVITVSIFDSDLKTDCHPLIFFSFALGLFFYQTLDNVDGKQARRTKSSSPLGELFDHGIDSLNCVLGGIVQCAAIGTGHSLYSVFLIVVACWPMYLSTWEEYHTGVLYLGYINGPTEGLLIAIGILLNATFNGIKFWKLLVKDHIDLSLVDRLDKFLNLKFNHQLIFMDFFVLFVLFALVVGHAPFCFYNTFKAIEQNRGLNPKKIDQRICSKLQAIIRLIPLMIFTVSSTLWIGSPNSNLLQNSKTIEFSLMICVIFGRISTRTILSHLTKSYFPIWSNSLIPLIVGCISINLPFFGLPRLITPFGELIMLRLSLFISFLTYTVTSLRVIEKFCKVLKIRCLSIIRPSTSAMD